MLHHEPTRCLRSWRIPPTLRRFLASAARLQEAVPDAVLVGESAAALHAGHRDSFDHDHVLPDLVEAWCRTGSRSSPGSAGHPGGRSLAIERARADAERREREEVAERVRQAVRRSGLSKARFAEQVGTSASRLSTYLNGKVTPSAAMLLRIERLSVQPAASAEPDRELNAGSRLPNDKAGASRWSGERR